MMIGSSTVRIHRLQPQFGCERSGVRARERGGLQAKFGDVVAATTRANPGANRLPERAS